MIKMYKFFCWFLLFPFSTGYVLYILGGYSESGQEQWLIQYASEFPELALDIRRAYANDYLSNFEFKALERKYRKFTVLKKLPHYTGIPVESELENE